MMQDCGGVEEELARDLTPKWRFPLVYSALRYNVRSLRNYHSQAMGLPGFCVQLLNLAQHNKKGGKHHFVELLGNYVLQVIYLLS